MSTSNRTNIPNSLNEHWMPFTDNKTFKKNPRLITDAKGVYLTNHQGKKMIDASSGLFCNPLGHGRKEITEAVSKQLDKLDYCQPFNQGYGGSFELATKIAKHTPGNLNQIFYTICGSTAVETAIKIVRKWGHTIKGIPDHSAKIVVCDGNFHGRTSTIISFSGDKGSKEFFGPHTKGFYNVPFDDINSLEEVFNQDKNIAGFLVEPIQGEAGVVVPKDGYLEGVRKLCTKHNILFVADEIQTGLGRTGKLLATQYEDSKPDILILGKALSGGTIPVSAVLCNSEIMDVIKPGQHGSTFGGNPLG